MLLPETDAQKLLVEGGAVRGVRTGDKGLGRDGTPQANYEPGAEITAQATVLAEGVQGMLDRGRHPPLRPRGRQPAGLRARRQGGLEGRPAARPRHPHAGLAAQPEGEAARVRRQLRLPDGRRPHLRRLRGRARLPRCGALAARHPAGVQDAPADPQAARGRRARRLGRQGDPRGRLLVAAGLGLDARRRDHGRRGGLRQRAEAQGRALRAALGDARGRLDLHAR